MNIVIDESFSGLSAPRRVAAIGRPDIPASERPGAALLALVGEFKRSGGFDRLRDLRQSEDRDDFLPARPAPRIEVGSNSARYFEDFRDDPELEG